MIHPIRRAGSTARSEEARLAEAVGLAHAIRLEVVAAEPVLLRQIRPSTLIGGGKLEELKALVEGQDVELVVVNAPVTPIQQRNLERALSAKVIDRTGLILEMS